MKICYITDFRSPIAQNWIGYFAQAGHDVHVISTYPCDRSCLPVSSLHVVPLAFSALAGAATSTRGSTSQHRHQRFSDLAARFVSRVRSSSFGSRLAGLRQWLGPMDLYRYLSTVRNLVDIIRPDLVHAMRIPYEGLLAAEALRNADMPLIISVWGNDFTLYANRYPLIRRLTRLAIQRTDALHPDCYRDLRLALAFGLDPAKPTLVAPGNGGIKREQFHAGSRNPDVARRWGLPESAEVVVNPRGFRQYVCNESFYRSIPLVLSKRPTAIFVSVAMQRNALAERWVRELRVDKSVRLLPSLSRPEMADLFRVATVTVSPSEHDGTPNTLLEAMACGAFPVAGDIESVREWITDGENGLLCDPRSPEALASAILRALNDAELRARAAEQNRKIIAERADYNKVMARAASFYQEVVRDAQHRRGL